MVITSVFAYYLIKEAAESNMGWEPVSNVLNEIQYTGTYLPS